MSLRAALLLAPITALALTVAADAGAVRAGFDANTLSANDDGSTGAQLLGFDANFFGVTFDSAYVNNNGNVTFTGSLSSFTPFDLTSTATPIIAPFFADVDTRGAGSAAVTYGTGTVGGLAAFGVNWVDVGYYSQNDTKLNAFQLVLIDRSDIAAGDFDIEFNYDQIEWETGEASGGTDGLGGSSARAGFSNGTGAADSFFELPGSAVNGAFLDDGSNALVSGRINSAVDGRYVFQARSGTVIEPPVPTVPLPAPALLLVGGVAGLGLLRRRTA